jgi:hypothetical protein
VAAGGVRGGSGVGGTTWRARSRPARAGEAAARVLGARGAKRGDAGQWVLGTWPARAAGRWAERKRSKGAGVR